MTKFFVADYHFGDSNIELYEGRPHLFIDEYLERYNNVVQKDDIVYFLGDIATKNFIDDECLNYILNNMSGYKVLVLGNHDKEISKDINFWISLGFDEVYKYPIIVDDFFICSHEPMYVSKQMPYVNIYGHVHGNENYKTFSSCGACVCVERHNFTPVCIKEIKKQIKKERDHNV